MLFMRPATAEDFQGMEIPYDYQCFMSEEVKQLIEEDQFKEAVHLFRKQTHRGVNEMKPYCETYQKYVQVKRDFEKGIVVYVFY